MSRSGLCDLWSAAAVAFRLVSLSQKTILWSQYQISSEVLWGRAVASCNDPMYYEYTADSMGDDEVALVSGTKLSRSDVRLKTLKYK